MEAEGIRPAIGKLVDKLTNIVLRYVKGRARYDVPTPLVAPGKADQSVTDYVPTAHLW